MARGVSPELGRGRLRVELRRARLEAGLTQLQVATDLGWSRSKILRIEAGHSGISRTDLLALLNVYGITAPDRVAVFIGLARESRRLMWRGYGDVLNPDFLIYLGFESSASRLQKADHLFIPAQLQTREYADVAIRSMAEPDAGEGVLRRQLEVRMLRQERFNGDDPPTTEYVVDEAALRRQPGDEPEHILIMENQLAHLLDMMKRPTVTLQVIPFQAGFHAGMLGPFALLSFPDGEDDDLLFLENARQSVVTRDHHELISQYRQTFLTLQKLALDVAGTANLIERVIKELSVPQAPRTSRGRASRRTR